MSDRYQSVYQQDYSWPVSFLPEDHNSALWQSEVRDMLKSSSWEGPSTVSSAARQNAARLPRKSSAFVSRDVKSKYEQSGQRNFDIKLTGDSEIDKEILEFYNNRNGSKIAEEHPLD